jgi:NAD(P)-dependent dehydrogenase (short-subunit alcohol dehydrogenase family)
MTESSVEGIVAKTGRSAQEARQILERKQPIGRLITPDEVAAAVWLCIESAAVSGQAVNVDGGAVQS